MNRKHMATVGLLASLALVGAAPRFVHAADETPAHGDLILGTQWWEQTAPEAKYEEFTEVPQGTVLREFSFRQQKKRHLLSFSGMNAFRNDQKLALNYWNGAKLRVDVDYGQIPHNLSEIARSPYAEVAPGVLLLPDSLQAAVQTTPSQYVSRMTDVLNNGSRIGLGFRTDVSKARVRIRPGQGWQYEVKGSRRNRSGTKPYGGSFGFNSAIEIWEPIDQTISDASARISYQKVQKNYGVALQVMGGLSEFANHTSELVWDNPKRITDRTYASAYVAGDGSVQGRLDLYPDNRSVFGNVSLGLTRGTKTALNATVGVARNTQNDDWLPFTINTAIPQKDSLPGTSTDAKVTIITMNYNLRYKIVPALSLTGRYRSYDYQNKTPVHDFIGQVRLDQVWEAIPDESEGFEYKNQVAGVDADWSPVRQASLLLTGEVARNDRPLRELVKDEEATVRGELHFRPAEGWELKGKAGRSNRYYNSEFLVDDYQDGATFVEQPGLRRFDIAPRLRDQASVGLSYSPNERWSFSVDGTYQFDKYNRTQLGLTRQRDRTGSGSISFQPSAVFDFMGTIGWAGRSATQRSRESGGGVILLSDSTTWQALITDEDLFWSLSCDWHPSKQKFSLGAAYDVNRAPSVYNLTNFLKTARDLPTTLYKHQESVVQARYQLLASTQLLGEWAWEQFEATDFASTDIPFLFPTTGANNAVFLGDSILSYRANRVALLVRRTF